jgi:Tripartite ATP-independent periplasmic transporters, DctQ component
MGANGKGNGKKLDGGANAPGTAPGKAPNGKAKAAPAAEAAPAEPTAAAASPEGSAAAEAAPAPAETAVSAGGPAGGPGEGTAGGEDEGASGVASNPLPVLPVAGAPDVAPEVRGAAWGHPFARFEQRWAKLEAQMLTFVLLWLILALTAWVFLNGLCESVVTTAGSVFRCVLLAIAFGAGAWVGTRKQGEERRRNLTLVGIAAAVAVVILWRRGAEGGGAALSFDRGLVDYFDNVKGWLQDGSTLALLGGLRGLATRLTLWLALLGGSLATSSGKHIHIDVVFRFLPKWSRVPVAVMNYLFAAAVCLAAVWGFFDHIAITSFGSNADDRAGVKIENAFHHVGNHAFFTRKQIGLDLRTLPHVIKGQRYDQWMTASAWNEWVDGAGFESRFEPAKVTKLHIPEGTHPPFVVSPDGEGTRGALAHTFGLVFPVGLLAIGLRFLLRALLTLSGHFAADPDEAHKEEIGGGRAATEGGA